VPITRVNQVWSTDITSIRLHAGFIYLVAVMDWFSRYVLSWAVSITMDVGFCLDALEHALGVAQPEVFNSDERTQNAFRLRVARAEIFRVQGILRSW
jgi:putative transposase